MYILIVGVPNSGKSNLSDMIRNAIFRSDSNSKITTDDEDRELKTFGSGKNEYIINVMRTLEKEDEEKADIIVDIKSKEFINWYHKIND